MVDIYPNGKHNFLEIYFESWEKMSVSFCKTIQLEFLKIIQHSFSNEKEKSLLLLR